MKENDSDLQLLEDLQRAVNAIFAAVARWIKRRKAKC